MENKNSPLNYEVIDDNTDDLLYKLVELNYPNKKIILQHEDKKFSFIIGKKEENGVLSPIFEKDGKYFMQKGEEYCQFNL